MSRETVIFERSVVYINGSPQVGQIMEIEMPELEWDTKEHESLGLIGVIAYPTRMPVLEATITPAGYCKALAEVAANPNVAATIMVRSAYGRYLAGTRVGVTETISTMRGRFMKATMGSQSQGEEENEYMMIADYVKQVHDGQLVVEYSADANIFKTGTTDYLAGIRAILGV